MIASLGYIVFQVLDFGIDEDEERSLNPELESLIKRMIASCKYLNSNKIWNTGVILTLDINSAL